MNGLETFKEDRSYGMGAIERLSILTQLTFRASPHPIVSRDTSASTIPSNLPLILGCRRWMIYRI
jgi:hypothetical protein